MILRHSLGRRPQLTFTADFHQLVQGDLVPGPCVLRYDPLRLIASDNCNPQHRIQAHLKFHPSGEMWQQTLLLSANMRLKDLADPAGQGVMLETTFNLPPGCEEIEAWFSCTHPDGHTDWDSDHGRNFWLRFALHDLHIESAAVRPATPNAPQDDFKLLITSIPAVESLDVRWRIPSVHDQPRQQHALVEIGRDTAGKQWRLIPEIHVAHEAVVVFDLVYCLNGRKYTDDNQGRWYVAD